MIRLELSPDEATLLYQQLAARIAELDRELVRTDQHRLQHALAEDVRRLGTIAQRLDALVNGAGGS
jgi:hypothetical protein